MNSEQRIQDWLSGPFDIATKTEIRRLQAADPKALADAFFKDLSFGTGGMRGVMGIGTNRMNIYTVQMATQGLAQYIKKRGRGSAPICVSYDVRHHSRQFAEETAKVFAGNGFRVLPSKESGPVPLLSFACRHYRCSAGVMITASHNPPQYNGYKVYWEGGAQVTAPHDQGIMEEVAQIKSPSQVLLAGDFEEIGSEIDAAYLAELKKLQLVSELSKVALKIVYTNLHGTGLRLIPQALKEWGYTHLSLVEEQRPFDGAFPAAPSPNPEEAAALQLGTKQLAREKGDLLIATDPDADRIGVAIAGTRLTGNQIACLCLHHIGSALTAQGRFPRDAAFIKTIVTTELFKAIAESFGGKCFDVLTGFKYIGEQIALWEKTGSPHYLFGAEESNGYLFGTFVRDKDAISSACLIAEAAAAAKKKGHTLLDVLHDLYRRFGVYRESLTNLSFSDSEAGMAEMNRFMKRLRTTPPTAIGGQPVAHLEDFLPPGGPLPPSDVLRFWLAGGSKLVIRPSGTEPKVKIYAEVHLAVQSDLAHTIATCDGRLASLVKAFSEAL